MTDNGFSRFPEQRESIAKCKDQMIEAKNFINEKVLKKPSINNHVVRIFGFIVFKILWKILTTLEKFMDWVDTNNPL